MNAAALDDRDGAGGSDGGLAVPLPTHGALRGPAGSPVRDGGAPAAGYPDPSEEGGAVTFVRPTSLTRMVTSTWTDEFGTS